MPPKKEVVEEVKSRLGRPSNTLKMGIVGLPNVGKSTTFNVMTHQNVKAENYPFCTIEPNLAQVAVPDARFDKLCEMFKPKSMIKAVLRIQDIAGLVPNAHKGEGLGNAFLSHIRECDGIYQVVRAFDDVDVIHTEVEIDPIRDLKIISDELIFKDLEFLDKRIAEVDHKISRYPTDKEAKEEKDILLKVQSLLTNGKWVYQGEWQSSKEIDYLNQFMFITAKPVIYLVNISEKDFLNKKNKWLPKIKKWIDTNLPGEMIPYSAEFERKLLESQTSEEHKADEKEGATLTQEQQQANAAAAAQSMLPKIIKSGYKILDLVYFFTAGPDEVRAWTIKQGYKAPQAAGVIHTDFERGFICAEIMKYDDLATLGSEGAVKAEGKYLQKGKDYEVEDGDVIFFKFNVTAQKKK